MALRGEFWRCYHDPSKCRPHCIAHHCRHPFGHVPRLVKGPDLPDRVVAMDLITALGTGFLLVYALFSADSFFLDVAIILALISFLGTVAFAFFIKNRHRKKE
jgi:multicomponent Na+:H+ antiporter subunit F